MKQIVFKKGKALCVEVPPPAVVPRHLLVEVRASCISPGTELAGLAGSGKTLWQRFRENPEKALAVLKRMMKGRDVLKVFAEAKAKLEGETPAGYSAAGTVRAVGAEVQGFTVGMRVAIVGAGFANHAEWAVVPKNLAIRIPDNVSFEQASTCALGGIALHGIRRADVQIGDYVTVVGCGAIGLLTVQMLRSAGCRVVGVDLDERRLALARRLGAEFVFNPEKDDVVAKVRHVTQGQGADRVILTVTTFSSAPIRDAFAMSRRKGRVVLIGVAGLELPREEMYRKELDFVISTSYGPGRYDPEYELEGHDYPYAYVRWTEQRNMEAYLQLIASGQVRLEEMIESIVPYERAPEAYASFMGENKPLLVILTYANERADAGSSARVSAPSVSDIESSAPLTAPGTEPTFGFCPDTSATRLQSSDLKSAPCMPPTTSGPLRVGIVGAGAFVQSVHIPNLKRLRKEFVVRAICDQQALSAREAARRLNAPNLRIESDFRRILDDPSIDVVLIGTRHDSHAKLAIAALNSGKAVFVEKPMCITRDEFDELKHALDRTSAPYMVGYNRRFAPAVRKIREITRRRVNPLMIHYTMNAGYIPYDHWVHTKEGGGENHWGGLPHF